MEKANHEVRTELEKKRARKTKSSVEFSANKNPGSYLQQYEGYHHLQQQLPINQQPPSQQQLGQQSQQPKSSGGSNLHQSPHVDSGLQNQRTNIEQIEAKMEEGEHMNKKRRRSSVQHAPVMHFTLSNQNNNNNNISDL